MKYLLIILLSLSSTLFALDSSNKEIMCQMYAGKIIEYNDILKELKKTDKEKIEITKKTIEYYTKGYESRECDLKEENK